MYRIRATVAGTTDYFQANSLSSPKTISVNAGTTYEVKINTKVNGIWSGFTDPVEFTSLPVNLILENVNPEGSLLKNSNTAEKAKMTPYKYFINVTCLIYLKEMHYPEK